MPLQYIYILYDYINMVIKHHLYWQYCIYFLVTIYILVSNNPFMLGRKWYFNLFVRFKYFFLNDKCKQCLSSSTLGTQTNQFKEVEKVTHLYGNLKTNYPNWIKKWEFCLSLYGSVRTVGNSMVGMVNNRGCFWIKSTESCFCAGLKNILGLFLRISWGAHFSRNYYSFVFYNKPF